MTLRTKPRQKVGAKPKVSKVNAQIGTCDKCGLPFNNSPKWSNRTQSTFVPTTCITCYHKAQLAKVRVATKDGGYCRECNWFLATPSPDSPTKHVEVHGRMVPLRNYCKSRRAQPEGPHPFFSDGFQDSVPCRQFTKRREAIA